MKVGQRLFLAVIPAVLGVLAMAALAYWGQRGREVPAWLLMAGILAALCSLGMAWHSTRYVARRIEALSARRGEGAAGEASADELDAIGRRIAEAARRGEARARAAEARLAEHALLLADACAAVRRRLDEVRLPLHILLASPFGALNENQEELAGAAQAAAEAAGAALETVRRVAELDAGTVQARMELIRPRDLLAPAVAAAEARMRRAGAALVADLPPDLPHVRADPRLAREAVSMVLDAVGAAPGPEVRLSADARGDMVRLRIGGGSIPPGAPFPLADRLLRLQGGAAARVDGAVEIHLPAPRDRDDA